MINSLGAHGSPQAQSLLRFVDTRDVLVTAARVLSPAAAFLQVEGGPSEAITVDGGDLSKANVPVKYGAGVTKGAVRLRA